MTVTFAGRRAASFAAAPLGLGTAVAAVLLLAGCAGGLIGPLPPVRQPAQASTISIFRDLALPGLIGPITVSIDGCQTFRVWSNQEYSFQLDPGEYIFDYTIGFNECRRVAYIQPRRIYRFRLTPNCDRFNDGCGTGIVTTAPTPTPARPPTSSTRSDCPGFDTGCY